jgi:hypothetical protein
MSFQATAVSFPLEVRRLIALCLLPDDRCSLALTSWAWLLAAWHGPLRRVVHKVASFVFMTRLLAPYGLDPPAVLDFRCDITEAVCASTGNSPAMQPGTSDAQPQLELEIACKWDLATLCQVVDSLAITSLVLHERCVTLHTLTESLTPLLVLAPQLQALTLCSLDLDDYGAIAIAAALAAVRRLQALNLGCNCIEDPRCHCHCHCPYSPPRADTARPSAKRH